MGVGVPAHAGEGRPRSPPKGPQPAHVWAGKARDRPRRTRYHRQQPPRGLKASTGETEALPQLQPRLCPARRGTVTRTSPPPPDCGRVPLPHTRRDPRYPARRPPPGGNSTAAGASSHWSFSVTPSRLLAAARAAIGYWRLSVGEGEPRWCPGCALVRRAPLPGAAAAGAAAGGAVMPAAGRWAAAGARHGAACAQAGKGGERGW